MLAIAALSARSGVELAAHSGIDTVAIDLFGDADTLRAAQCWLPLGDAQGLRVEPRRLLEALATLAGVGRGVQGWVAGSGFEACPQALEEGARILPLLGTAPADVRRVRDARAFFAALDRLGLPHPPVRFEPPPASPWGWLAKDMVSAGGWGVRRAEDVASAPSATYWQRERSDADAMSATFVANGSDVRLLGINRQLSMSLGVRPYLFEGVIGPVALDTAHRNEVQAALAALVPEFGLRGLGSLDFLFDGQGIELLEINPRLPASAALYRDDHPLLLHWQACRDGVLPAPRCLDAASSGVHGWRTVFAPRPLDVGEAAAARLAALPCTHDLPCAASRIGTGHPLCSVSADGASAAQVQAALQRRSEQALCAVTRSESARQRSAEWSATT